MKPSRRRTHRWPRSLLLIAVSLVRLPFAWFSIGWDHPNESHRLLEPLATLRGWSACAVWEYPQGLLSWWPVVWHHWLLQGLGLWGEFSPIQEIRFLHLVYSLLSLTQIWACFELVLLLPRSSPDQRQASTQLAERTTLATLAAGLVGFWPELVYQSTRLMDYSLEASGLAILILLALTSPSPQTTSPLPLKQPRCSRSALTGPWTSVMMGVVLGVLFFIRYLSLLHGIGLSLLLLIHRYPPWPLQQKAKQVTKNVTKITALVLMPALLFATSTSAVILGLGMIEKHWSGDPRLLGPFLTYLDYNWLQDGAARNFGRAPWLRYFSDTAKFYGIFGLLGLIGLLGLKPLARSSSWRKLHPLIALLFLIPFVIYSLTSHKEARFLYGTLWLLIPLFFSGFPPVGGFFQKQRAPHLQETSAENTAPLPGSKTQLLLTPLDPSSKRQSQRACALLRASFAPLSGLRWHTSLGLTCLVIGFFISAVRVSHRFGQFQAQTQALARIGVLLKAADPLEQTLVVLDHDPTWAPAGFLLRTHAPFCHHNLNLEAFPCPCRDTYTQHPHWMITRNPPPLQEPAFPHEAALARPDQRFEVGSWSLLHYPGVKR